MHSSVLADSLVVPGGWPQSDARLPSELMKVGTTGVVAFQFFFLQNGHCAVSQVSGFWRKSIVLPHQVQAIFHLATVSSLRSGLPEPAVCVSGAQLCAPWLPAHSPSSLAVWPDAHQNHTLTSAPLLAAVADAAMVKMWWGEARQDDSPAHTWLAPFSPSYPSIIPSIFFYKTSCILPSSTFSSSVKNPFINPWNVLPLCSITGLVLSWVVSHPCLVQGVVPTSGVEAPLKQPREGPELGLLFLLSGYWGFLGTPFVFMEMSLALHSLTPSTV